VRRHCLGHAGRPAVEILPQRLRLAGRCDVAALDGRIKRRAHQLNRKRVISGLAAQRSDQALPVTGRQQIQRPSPNLLHRDCLPTIQQHQCQAASPVNRLDEAGLGCGAGWHRPGPRRDARRGFHQPIQGRGKHPVGTEHETQGTSQRDDIVVQFLEIADRHEGCRIGGNRFEDATGLGCRLTL